jgi:hypothetical protein
MEKQGFRNEVKLIAIDRMHYQQTMARSLHRQSICGRRS